MKKTEWEDYIHSTGKYTPAQDYVNFVFREIENGFAEDLTECVMGKQFFPETWLPEIILQEYIALETKLEQEEEQNDPQVYLEYRDTKKSKKRVKELVCFLYNKLSGLTPEELERMGWEFSMEDEDGNVIEN